MAKRKVRLKKKSKLVVLIILLILVLGFGAYYQVSYFSKVDKKIEDTPIKKEVKKEVKKEPKEYSASLFMVGDALIHYGVYNLSLIHISEPTRP